MAQSNSPATINILDRDYRIACPAEERELLIRASKLLEKRMRDTRNRSNGHILNQEKLAIIAGLNITSEYISTLEATKAEETELAKRINALQFQIDKLLVK
ncbi:MAG: cell division protein ZapA [Kangiellaceae bacterium]|jgi:cell division protein ZapA|nr:cell division protein ZapA [Kangiellaceae bacterium]|tara:strand:- start:10169 stop:10471 length:303 start_codon:yes stop_codon:yes gene_type:complete